MEFLPDDRCGKTVSRGAGARLGLRRVLRRVAALATVAALTSLLLPSGVGSAESARYVKPGGTPGSLQATVAEANKLSNEIDVLGQQYDSLRIQLGQARAETQLAQQAAVRDERALSAGRAAVGQIAAQGFMVGGLDPTVQLLQSPDPQLFLDRSSIIVQIAHEQTGTMSLLASAEAAAERARATASQEAAQAAKLTAAMNTKVAQIQAKENVLNSSAFSQAMGIFQQTGSYPNVEINGDSLGEQAVRWALSRLGDWYVWGAAGPDTFDCSGLVMWAYEHVGIQLEHLTYDQWNEGEHIPRSELKPGDLLFFFNLGHVGMFLGGNLMVDAPTQGQRVQVQEIPWGGFDGAVEII